MLCGLHRLCVPGLQILLQASVYGMFTIASLPLQLFFDRNLLKVHLLFLR